MALRRRRIELALQCFERAKQLTDRNAWPFFYLGRVYLQLGRLDDAIDVLYDGERFVQDNHIRGRRVLSAIRTQLAYCYLFDDQLDLAEPIILRLWEDERSPEVIRAYAALTIKKRGISQAHEALKELERAEIRNHYDRCQFHLLYGLFYLGIGEASRATAEFEKAHKADKTNVFVMINLARTLLTTASELWADGSDEHQPYVRDCAALVSEILGIDSDNQEGIELAHQLYTKFKVEVKAKQVGG
jgi:tetratricopeptide (TPR) repeat protein